MGWKNVKDHYGIGHIVKMVDGTIHIGSGYVGSLVTVTADGVAEVNRTFSGSAELERYRDQISSDPALFRQLMADDDVFSASIPVYTWHEGEILEKRCEEFGWPNVTHDGEVMYENRFFLDRNEAIERACRDARSAVEAYGRHVDEARQDLARREALLAQAVEHEASFAALALAAGPAPDRSEDMR